MVRDLKRDKCKKRRRLGAWGLRIWDLDPREGDSGKLEIREEGGKMGQGIGATTRSKMRRLAREELPGALGRRGDQDFWVQEQGLRIGVLVPERIWAESCPFINRQSLLSATRLC